MGLNTKPRTLLRHGASIRESPSLHHIIYGGFCDWDLYDVLNMPLFD